MKKVNDALKILQALGLPRQQQNERSALTLLALANLKQRGKWTNAEQPLLRIWDIMDFMRTQYGKDYAANSRETIRRQTIHQFEQARLVDRNPDDPSRPTNSGKNAYALTDDVLSVLQAYGTASFDSEVAAFGAKFGTLHEAYAKRRRLQEVNCSTWATRRRNTLCATMMRFPNSASKSRNTTSCQTLSCLTPQEIGSS